MKNAMWGMAKTTQESNGMQLKFNTRLTGYTFIIAAFLAALALAGCGKENKDGNDKNEISETEALEFPEEIVPYLEYYSGSFCGEYSSYDYVPDLVDIYWHEDIQFTPYERPIEVSGVSDQIVYGEATITDYSISESDIYSMEAVKNHCYYYIELESGYNIPNLQINIYYTLYITFYEYDTSTGLTTKTGKRCGLHEVDDTSFVMESYWEWSFYSSDTVKSMQLIYLRQ